MPSGKDILLNSVKNGAGNSLCSAAGAIQQGCFLGSSLMLIIILMAKVTG